MKQIINIALLLLVFTNCKTEVKQKIDLLPDIDIEQVENLINNPQTADKHAITKDIPSIEIVDRVFNFGTIIQGDKVKHKFKIKNTGKKDLLILDMRSSCGCTVVEKLEKPISPGQEDFIVVEFDSKDKIGDQSRKIAIFTNVYPSEDYVEMKGFIKK